jgi:hypothetical protein
VFRELVALWQNQRTNPLHLIAGENWDHLPAYVPFARVVTAAQPMKDGTVAPTVGNRGLSSMQAGAADRMYRMVSGDA